MKYIKAYPNIDAYKADEDNFTPLMCIIQNDLGDYDYYKADGSVHNIIKLYQYNQSAMNLSSKQWGGDLSLNYLYQLV